jgi:hypothetical protein
MEEFYWTQDVPKYFENIKEAMRTTHVLATPYFTKTFIMELDDLGHEIGVVLMQQGRLLFFEICQIMLGTKCIIIIRNINIAENTSGTTSCRE